MAAVPMGFALLRRFQPVLRLGSIFVVTRYDDVHEVFRTDCAFAVPYKANLDIITDGQPFFLGMADTPTYHAQLDAMRRVFKAEDLPRLGDRAEALAEAFVAASGGRLNVVEMIRDVTFDLFEAYLGLPKPPVGRLDVWATRLFEFQFTGTPKDTALRSEVDVLAPAFRDHIDAEIARWKATPGNSDVNRDDIIARCLALQTAGVAGYTDVEIRTAILCMIVGGPPQPPMVVPQAMEQLLRRPVALALAQTAATGGDDAALHDIVMEAMRFDPLAPALPRHAVADWVIARGTRRQQGIPAGSTVLTAFSSAMMDDRRIPAPRTFDPGRRPHEYVHFGRGLHECFGRFINHATLHRMLKPLLARPGLRRAPGTDGRLSKSGIFAERLVVTFD